MNARIILIIITIILPTLASAQYTSVRGRFQVDEKRGCAPFTLNITNTDILTPCNNNCVIRWGDGTANHSTDGILLHTYPTAGSFWLSINYDASRGPDSVQVTVFPNTKPTFEIYTCSGNEVQVKVTDANYDSYIINYNDLSPEVTIPKGSLAVNHTFPSSGTKTISVRGLNTASSDNCTPPATKNVAVSVVAPPVPTIDQVVITSSSMIDLQFTALFNVLYRLEMSVNGGSFSNLGNQLDVSTASVQNLDTDNNFYCFRLGTVDPCTGSVNFSQTICSADLAATAQNNANGLTWTTLATGITNFTIQRDGVVLTTVTGTTFTDTDVVCGTEYCYQIISNYPGSAESFSTIRCVTAISTDVPTAIADVSSVVDGGSVELIWQPDAVFTAETYTVLRHSNGSSFNPLQGGLVFPSFTDDNYSTFGQFCYRIDYTNNCENVSSPGIEACPIILTYTTNSDNQIILNWTDYQGWTGGVDHYEIDKYDLNRTSLGTVILGNITTYTDPDLADQGYFYTIRAIPNSATTGESVSNEVKALRKLIFAYPKAFTPDKQGPQENETFNVFVTAEFIDEFEMKIFNRWGELIFSTSDLLKGWDGKFNGQPQPEGTYTFTAVLRDKTGRTFRRDGSVVLLRKK
jgi:gliding motility-associated-like protein